MRNPQKGPNMARRVSTRWAARIGLASLSSLVLVTGAMALSAPAQAASANPYAPAYGHAYRHGAIPTRSVNDQMRAYQAAHPGAVPAVGSGPLHYGGGVDGIGVTTGAPKVDLVFSGSQWGTT